MKREFFSGKVFLPRAKDATSDKKVCAKLC